MTFDIRELFVILCVNFTEKTFPVMNNAKPYQLHKRLKALILLLQFAVFSLFCSADRGVKATFTTDELRRLCDESMTAADYKCVNIFALRLLRQAETEGDRLHTGYGYFYLGASELFMGKMKQSIARLEKAAGIAREENSDSLMAYAYNNIAIYEISANLNAYIAQHYFLESLDYAKKAHMKGLQKSIYGNLASVALIQGDTMGVRYARECYDLGRKDNDPRHVYIGANHLAGIYHYMGRDDMAVKYIEEALKLHDENGFGTAAVLYMVYSGVLRGTGKYAAAETYAKRAIAEAEKQLPPTLPDCCLEYAHVLAATGRLKESNDMLERAAVAAKKYNTYTAIVDIYELMADNFEALGNTAKALEYVRLAKDFAVAANEKDKKHMINERSLVLDMTKKEQEAALYKERLDSQMRLNMALTASFALLAILLVMAFVNAKNKNRLYKNIVMQHTKTIAREDEMQRRIDELEAEKSQETKPHAAKIGDDKGGELYRRLCQLMEHERPYTDNQLNRERLAEMLGTNRTYLSQVISDNSGMNYSQFVNTYRVNEAVRVLSDKTRVGYPLKQLCFDIGFSSLSTFYKIFKEQVGITPSAYRKSYEGMDQN